MPTFNQLVRKGRKSAEKKSTAPALLKVTTLYRRRLRIQLLHRREEFVQQLRQLLLRSLTQLLERLPEFVFPMVSK